MLSIITSLFLNESFYKHYYTEQSYSPCANSCFKSDETSDTKTTLSLGCVIVYTVVV